MSGVRRSFAEELWVSFLWRQRRQSDRSVNLESPVYLQNNGTKHPEPWSCQCRQCYHLLALRGGGGSSAGMGPWRSPTGILLGTNGNGLRAGWYRPVPEFSGTPRTLCFMSDDAATAGRYISCLVSPGKKA